MPLPRFMSLRKKKPNLKIIRSPVISFYLMTREEDINKAVEVLRNGGIILYPTDTVWGIGCDATNPDAVRRVYEVKHRDDSKAMICLVDNT